MTAVFVRQLGDIEFCNKYAKIRYVSFPNNPQQEKFMSSTMTMADQQKAKEFVQPKVKKGNIVKWFKGGDRNLWCPAIVTSVGTKTVSLSIIMDGRPTFMPQDGIRHVDDPESRDFEFAEYGAWDHSDETKELASLRDEMTRLMKQPIK